MLSGSVCMVEILKFLFYLSEINVSTNEVNSSEIDCKIRYKLKFQNKIWKFVTLGLSRQSTIPGMIRKDNNVM